MLDEPGAPLGAGAGVKGLGDGHGGGGFVVCGGCA